jgi:hypothetical protein
LRFQRALLAIALVSIPQFHSSIFQSFNFRLRLSILQYFNISIFVAEAATNCAPKGQLLLAQGIALG